MGILDGKKVSENRLYEEAGKLEIQEEVVNRQSRIAEREAVIKQLKREYGPDWKKTLGLDKLTDVETLKSFLRSAKASMSKSGNTTFNPGLSPLPPSSLRMSGNGSPASNSSLSPLPTSKLRMR